MKSLFFTFLFLVGGVQLFAQESIKTSLEITNIKKSGPIMVAIYNNAKDFLSNDKAFKTETLNPGKDKTFKFDFFNLPPGKYAIAIFIDENNNGELDTNFIGIPSEQYGFTGKNLPRTRAPRFEESAVVIDANNRSFTIKLN